MDISFETEILGLFPVDVKTKLRIKLLNAFKEAYSGMVLTQHRVCDLGYCHVGIDLVLKDERIPDPTVPPRSVDLPVFFEWSIGDTERKTIKRINYGLQPYHGPAGSEATIHLEFNLRS